MSSRVGFTLYRMDGVENKVVELIAKDLEKRVKYQFGVIGRYNTLNAKRCDVIMST